jgi:hypothetical protein
MIPGGDSDGCIGERIGGDRRLGENFSYGGIAMTDRPLRPLISGLIMFLAFGLVLAWSPGVQAVTISISDVASVEGDADVSASVTFTVALSEAATAGVTFSFSTADGSATAAVDFESMAGEGAIDPGATAFDITVRLIGNSLDEPDKTFALELTDVLGAECEDCLAIGTIRNDDVPASAIPEPGTVLLVSSGVAVAAAWRRRGRAATRRCGR